MTPPDTTGSLDADLEFILLAQLGDLDAFDVIVLEHQSIIAAILHRFAKNQADLEDLLQETFVKAWRALPDWKPEKPFLHWLKRIALRVGLEDNRKRKRSPLATASDLNEASHLFSESPLDDARDALDEAIEILSHLPADDQTILTLIHLHGMTMDEIAAEFGWSRANAKIKAFRARGRLRKILTKYGYSAE